MACAADRARALALAIVLLSFATDAAAHGPPAAAVGLLGLGGDEATLVRLTRGLAHRVPDGFRFVCPEAWGGDVTAPAAALPGGPALIAGELLFLVEPDGRVSPHPSQVGVGIALASNRDSLFGLFKRDGKYELQRVTESASELVRALDEPFGALAASDGQLSLLGWSGSTLVLQTLSLQGEPGERVTWNTPNQVAYAELRTAAEQLYVLIWGNSAPWVTLGRVTERGYELLRKANTNIAGPVALASSTLVVLDGNLEALEAGALIDGRGSYVTCLGSEVGQPYACAHGDVMRVDQDGVGAPLFELSSLREPDYQTLPEAARSDCNTRWLDLREHAAPPAGWSDGADAAARDAAAPDAAVPDAAGLTRRDAMPAGCALGTGTVHAWWLSVIVLAVLSARRRDVEARGSARERRDARRNRPWGELSNAHRSRRARDSNPRYGFPHA